MKIKKCETQSCVREAAITGLCTACYSGMHYWMRKGVSAVMKRKTQLRILDERLENLRPANVREIRKRA